MKKIKTENAVGMMLCHDITKIVPGKFKGRIFKKGHIIQDGDIPQLLDCGKEHVYVWDNNESMLHENEAAEILAKAVCGQGLEYAEPNQGKINLTATDRGLLKVNADLLAEINSIDEIAIATLHTNQVVEKGQVVAGTRVIPLAIEKAKMDAVEKTAKTYAINILPLQRIDVGMVTTGNEVYYGRIKDAFGPAVKNKLDKFDCRVTEQIFVPDDVEKIKEAINKLVTDGCEMVVITGGMSVDPDDVTPTAIKESGAEIVTYGTPVLPGSMLLLAYYKNIPVFGLPGCVMYSKTTVFDLLLPRALAGDIIAKKEIVNLGHGGLCNECDECKYPHCAFGKER